MPEGDEVPQGDPEPTGDPELTGETGEAGDPAAAPAAEALSGDDEKDEKGVPLKNRLAEANRKLDRANREIEDERLRRETMERQFASMGQPPAAPAAPASEEDLAQRILSKPKEFQGEILSEARKIASWEIAQQKIKEDTLREFPDLADPSSDFFKDVSREYAFKKQYYGFQNGQEDIALLRDSAERVDRKRLKTSMESGVPRRVTPSPGDAGKPKPKSGKVELSETQKMVARELGMTDDQARTAYAQVADGTS